MNYSITPYLTFGGRCQEAIDFYGNALGAEVLMKQTFGESSMPMPEEKQFPGWESMVMHAALKVGQNTLMLSDGWGQPEPFSGFMISLNASSPEDCDRYFSALAEGGAINMELQQTFWTEKFGMVTDKFGVGWMVSLWHDPSEGA